MDELGPDERPWLDALRTADEPTAADRARVRAALVASIGAAGAATAVGKTGAVAKAVKTGIVVGVWKIGLASVVLLAVAGGTTWRLSRPATPVVATSAPVPVASAVASATEAPVAPTQAAPAQSGNAPLTIAAVASAAPSADVRVATSARPSATVAAVPPPAAHLPETADALEGEMALLTNAQRALERGDTATAIGALSRHRREHPAGALAVERDGLLAIASCDARQPEGRALAERFVARNATSPLVARVRAACLAH